MVVDGTNHVQALDAAEEGKAVTAIQVWGGKWGYSNYLFSSSSLFPFFILIGSPLPSTG